MLFDIGLHPSKQVGVDGVPEDGGALVGGGHLDAGGVGVAPLGDGDGELLHEHGEGAQLAGVDEVEERPELLKIVLKGGAYVEKSYNRQAWKRSHKGLFIRLLLVLAGERRKK